MKVVSENALRVTTLDGAAVLFEPGVAREVSETIGLLALQQGAKQVDGDAVEPAVQEETTDVSFNELVDKLVALMEEGDATKFKKDNTPKAAVVNELAGKTLSTEQREAAWEAALRS
jgi:hypothetical protein